MGPLIYGDHAITYIPVYKFSITYGRGAARRFLCELTDSKAVDWRWTQVSSARLMGY